MAQSIRETCLAALFVRLQAITGIDDLIVERNRDALVDTYPTIVQVDGGDRITDEQTGATAEAAEVTVEAYLQAETPALLSARIDAAYVAVHEAALNDPTLDGAAHDVRKTGFDQTIDRLSVTPTAWFALALSVEWQRAERDVTTTI